MGHITRNTGWANLDVDTATGRLFFEQLWKYVWDAQAPEKPWTYAQKKEFHTLADRMIWKAWSNRVGFKVLGKSEFAKRFAGKVLPMNMDANWVLSNQHWTVTVSKVPKGNRGAHVSNVKWNQRTIELSTEDFSTTIHKGGIVAHEFGHSSGNTAVLKRGDEYKKTSPHHKDKASIINVGSELRTRHFRTILEELNKMIPETRFVTATVGK